MKFNIFSSIQLPTSQMYIPQNYYHYVLDLLSSKIYRNSNYDIKSKNALIFFLFKNTAKKIIIIIIKINSICFYADM